MDEELPDPVFDAYREAAAKGVMPTNLDTAGLRQLAAETRRNNYFTARGNNVAFVSEIKRVMEQIASGEFNEAAARAALLECIRATGYTPEGGFPDAPAGSVPPAVAGSLQDLSSWRRIDLIVDTQRKLAEGAGLMAGAMTEERIAAFPAFEIYTLEETETPRDWAARWKISGGKFYGTRKDDTPLGAPGRLMALKGDPVFGELGSSGNFDDALDVDFPPFYFRSGKWMREVPLRVCRALGITGPNGETIDEWIASGPVTMDGPLPRPRISVAKVDMQLRGDFQEETGAVPLPGKPDVLELPPAPAPADDSDDEYDGLTNEQILEIELRKARGEYDRRQERRDG